MAAPPRRRNLFVCWCYLLLVVVTCARAGDVATPCSPAEACMISGVSTSTTESSQSNASSSAESVEDRVVEDGSVVEVGRSVGEGRGVTNLTGLGSIFGKDLTGLGSIFGKNLTGLGSIFGKNLTGLGSIFDKNLTKCLLSAKLVKCFKVSLLERLTQLLEISDKVKLNRTMDLMDGFVSLEPVTDAAATPDDVELIERMKKEGGSDKEVDLLLISGLARFFKDKSLKLHFIPGYTIELHPAKTYSDYVSLSLKLSGETPEQVAARTMKMGSPFMMLGPMITLGMLPFSLASLNYMVMNAYAMNNMALMNVLWTTIREHVFEDHGEAIVYRNPGYENEFKKYRNKGYANENKQPQSQSAYQHGKPVIHEGLKASPSIHGHASLIKHNGPPRPLVHYNQPHHDNAGSHSHVHIKSVTIPAGDKLRFVNRPPVAVMKPNFNRPRPMTVKLPEGVNLRVHNHGPPRQKHVVRRPTIPLNNGHPFMKHNFVTNGGHNINGGHLLAHNGGHHSSENSYVNEVNHIKNNHASQSVQNGPVFGHILNPNNIGIDPNQNQFQPNSQHLNGNSFEVSGNHNGNVFEPVFPHNGQNLNHHQFETLGSHVNNVHGPHLHENNIGGVGHREDVSHTPNVVVPNGHNSGTNEGNFNGFNSQDFNAQNSFNNHNSQQNRDVNAAGNHPEHNYEAISHQNLISDDIHLLNTAQQVSNHDFVGGDMFGSPVQFENHQNVQSSYLDNQNGPHQNPVESSYKPAGFQEAQRAQTNLVANGGGAEGAEWVPQNHGQLDRDTGSQNWPIVYVDPSTSNQQDSNSRSSNTGQLEPSNNHQQVDSGVHRPDQSLNDNQSNPHGSQGDFVHINFGNDNGYTTNQRTSKVNNEDPSKVTDPAISFQDSVDLDDKPFSDVGSAQRVVQPQPTQIVQSSEVGTAQRLVQGRPPQIIQPSVHIASPFSPMVVPESDTNGQTKSEQSIGFRPTILPVSQSGNNRRSGTTDEGGKDSEWKSPQRENFENTKDAVRMNFASVGDKTSIRESADTNRRSDNFEQDENEWKAANNPKFENQNRRSDTRNVGDDSKSSKNIPFRNKGSFGFVVDDNEAVWRSSKHKTIENGTTTTTDIIYDDSHDGNWEVEPGLTEEVFVVENVHEEPVLKPRDAKKPSGR